MDSNTVSPELIQYFKDVAKQVVGDPHIMVECNYCHAPVEVWEAILVAQKFVGVPAHLNCSKDVFFEAMENAKLSPEKNFDYEEF